MTPRSCGERPRGSASTSRRRSRWKVKGCSNSARALRSVIRSSARPPTAPRNRTSDAPLTARFAEATNADLDPDRRGWHRAQAAARPDDDVARELETSAARVEARGGLAAAAAFLQRSAELSVDVAERARRALVAAEAKRQVGALDDASVLASMAEQGPLNDDQRGAARGAACAGLVRVRSGWRRADAARQGGAAP